MAFFDKLKQGLSKTKQSMSTSLNSMFAGFTGENEDFFDELEELLILSDAGVRTAAFAVTKLRETVKQKGLRGADQVKSALAEILTDILKSGKNEDNLAAENNKLRLGSKPSVILVVGVNGVGKTTTIGKLAKLFCDSGKNILLCAGDTFRAAAAEQLSIWAERAGCAIIRHEEGGDPAAVLFDALSAAKAREVDIIICDTAGRLHNRQNLMNELSKIRRVIERELPGHDCETLLVLDATTGQNGLIQAKQFNEFTQLSGIILTKLDGTAKGGIVFAIASELGVPVKYIGVGEKAEDLLEFDPESFVSAMLE